MTRRCSCRSCIPTIKSECWPRTSKRRLTGEPLRADYRLHARDGRVVWVHDEAHVIDDPDSGEHVLQGYLLDITARTEAEEQLRHQAFHDPLTGLANRALFTDRVQHALVVRSGNAAVLFLDLDDFKAVNDGLGHVAGDTLLRAVGVRLRASLSPTHTVARMGGDEFAILVERADAAAAALDAAERITAALQTPFDVDGREVFVTASVGIAVGGDAEELLRCSDVAMYGAKASGKAQYMVYAPRMDEHLVGRLELVADLRRAAIAAEFVLHYQPVVELLSGEVLGVEALVRWQHPTRGLLQPSEFVHLAEETGRIVEIGRWVLAEACRQTAEWRERLAGGIDLAVSVNVSTRQVRRPGLIEDVEAALASSGLAPEHLTLEITESVLARRREELTDILEEVTSRGVRLALDDFGTGYSSLSLLQDLPVHTLKVDRSFVQSIEAEGGRAPFVQSDRRPGPRRSSSRSSPRASRRSARSPRSGGWAVGSARGSTSRGHWRRPPSSRSCATAAGDPPRKRQPPDARFQTSSDSRIAPSWSAVTATSCSG